MKLPERVFEELIFLFEGLVCIFSILLAVAIVLGLLALCVIKPFIGLPIAIVLFSWLVGHVINA